MKLPMFVVAGMIAGAAAGAFNGAAVAIAKEGAEGLIEITNGIET